MPRALVLSGDGINCEVETAAAARESGFSTTIVHVNDFLKTRGTALAETHLLVLPGGFSFGDELGSGQILALKLKHGLGAALTDYIARGGAVLGICNGFQVLARLGVFGRDVVLTQNEGGHFMNRWVGLEIASTRCIFTERLRRAGVSRLELPIRHGEGRLVCPRGLGEGVEGGADIVLRYDENVNGAWERAAGLVAYRGRVLGLMPHPEAFWAPELHPWGAHRGVPLGVELFVSAFKELSEENKT